MELPILIKEIANILKEFDSEKPVHKHFKPGIGPFGEPQLVKEISKRLNNLGFNSVTKQTPDLSLINDWEIEIKIVRPYGDNGKDAEDWSVNMLHPYEGNTSLIGDAIKLRKLDSSPRKCVLVIGFEHDPPVTSLDPMFSSFELIAKEIIGINLGQRYEETRKDLVHPTHQVVRVIGWEIL